jgi:hypothetical protein
VCGSEGQNEQRQYQQRQCEQRENEQRQGEQRQGDRPALDLGKGEVDECPTIRKNQHKLLPAAAGIQNRVVQGEFTQLRDTQSKKHITLHRGSHTKVLPV